MKPNIKLTNFHVDIPIYTSDSFSLRKKILGGVPQIKISNVLKDINLEIISGEKVGVYGSNGAGKTSLLRALAGGYFPTKGSIDIRGNVSGMIDIGLGLDQEASGFDNIKLKIGLMFPNLRNDEKIIQNVINFSGLEDVIHLPLRTYSSGMAMRLAFSIVTEIKTDILVLDEWLSVGDADFAEKSEKKMQSLVEGSSIMVIASHSMDLLNKICTRLITLDHGMVISDVKL